MDAFHVYDIYNTKWNIEKPKSTPVPKGRAFHTLTNFGDSKIAMIGGVLKLQYKSQDERMERWVWVYDTSKLSYDPCIDHHFHGKEIWIEGSFSPNAAIFYTFILANIC